MAIITASAIVEDAVQADGRRYIRERHSEVDGVCHDFVWLAEAEQNAEAGLATRAAWLENYLVERELESNVVEVESECKFQFRYSTSDQLATRLRERFRTAKGLVACRIAAVFLAQPDARLMNVFELTQQQVDNLRPRLQAKVDAHDALEAVEGE